MLLWVNPMNLAHQMKTVMPVTSLAVWERKHALQDFHSRHVCVLGELHSHLNKGNTALLCFYCRVCECVCVERRGACQNVLAISSPSNRGIWDVHPRLAMSLVLKSQWDIKKLSSIKTGLCRGQADFLAKHFALQFCAWGTGSVSEWSQSAFIHLLQMLDFYCGCCTEETALFWFNNN